MSVALPSILSGGSIPIVAPTPFAQYDLNVYSTNSSSLTDLKGGSPATVSQATLNSYYPGSNSHLRIYAINSGTPPGSITLPYISGVKAFELWVKYDNPIIAWYPYLVDARLGTDNSYWIFGNGIDTIGDTFQGGNITINNTQYVISGGTPTLNPTIGNRGWVHIVVNLPSGTTFNDDITFFGRYSGHDGCPLNVAYIAIHKTELSADDIKALYNQRCSRFGLASA